MGDLIFLFVIIGPLVLLFLAGLLIQWRYFWGERPIRSFLDAVKKEPERGAVLSSRQTPRADFIPANYTSLEEGLRALRVVHQLEEITVSTIDGLLVASTKEDADEDAAIYSQLFVGGITPRERGVRLLQVQHGSERLVCMLKGGGYIPEERAEAVKREIMKLLKHWL